MSILTILFWICLAVIFYNYVGYGILIWLMVRIKRLFRPGRQTSSSDLSEESRLPSLTLVVAAYNEEGIIEEKIANCLELDYPEDKCNFLFITDGSDDGTPDRVRSYPQIQLLHQPERKGKTAALNRAMQYVATPIVVFCDANTLLNRAVLKRIARHYEDPATGGVAGEKRVKVEETSHTAASSEGIYWQYESLLKRLDADLYTVTGAAGELFSIRTALWEPLPEEVVLDDFIISARINLRGYRIAYDPSAWASELPSSSLKEEKKRKIRISAGAFQAMSLLKPLFNPFRHPVLFFQFFSHRFLRWTLTPLALPLLFLSNLFLLLKGSGDFYLLFFLAQVVFYLSALFGAYLTRKGHCPKVLKIAHYLLFMNYMVYLGFLRFLRGKQTAAWEKAGRKTMVSPA